MDKYLKLYKEQNIAEWEVALELESLGHLLVTDFEKHKDQALSFINRVEIWKAMGITARVKGVGKNKQEIAQNAIKKIISSADPIQQIEALHTLVGFGSYEESGVRRAKVASAAMRFLYPKAWGVVDWRSAAIAQAVIENNYDINKVKSEVRLKKEEFKSTYERINSTWAVQINEDYRKIGNHFAISENAVVDQTLFGISLEIWPLRGKKLPRRHCGSTFDSPKRGSS